MAMDGLYISGYFSDDDKLMLDKKLVNTSFSVAGYCTARRALPPRAPPLLYCPRLDAWFFDSLKRRRGGTPPPPFQSKAKYQSV